MKIFSPSLYIFLILISLPAQAAELAGKLSFPSSIEAEQLVLWAADGPGVAPLNAKNEIITQRKKEFYPLVTVLSLGASLQFDNLDYVAHNAFSLNPGAKFDLGMHPPKAKPRLQKMDKVGRIAVFCNIHPDMNLLVNVIKHGSYAKLNADGSFSLPWKGAAPKELQIFVDGPAWQTPLAVKIVQKGAQYAGEISGKQKKDNLEHRRKDGSRYPDDKKAGY